MHSYKDINIETIAFSKAKKLDKGGFVSWPNTSPGAYEKVTFQLGNDKNPMTAPYGISEPYDEKQQSNKRLCEFTLSDPDMLTFFRNLDKKVVKTVAENSHLWFSNRKDPKPLTEEDVLKIYSPVVRDQNSNFDPTLKCKVVILKQKESDELVKIWRQVRHGNAFGKEFVDPNTPEFWKVIGKYARVVPYCELGGLYMMSKSFSLAIIVTHMVKMADATIQEFPFAFEEAQNFADVNMENTDNGGDDDDIASSAPEVFNTVKNYITNSIVNGSAPNTPFVSSVPLIAPAPVPQVQRNDGNIDDVDPMDQ